MIRVVLHISTAYLHVSRCVNSHDGLTLAPKPLPPSECWWRCDNICTIDWYGHHNLASYVIALEPFKSSTETSKVVSDLEMLVAALRVTAASFQPTLSYLLYFNVARDTACEKWATRNEQLAFARTTLSYQQSTRPGTMDLFLGTQGTPGHT
ncbi:uncharacterized protein K489DRAFT_95480 [Dissoconium aciculare CBS 342.82]|uniref:Uncharacterized protein n=1 Tax=Dissoconium aciculare CBS 342.82 TaxID=1314786 RepID=A0A6J3LT80_9PEZI|nr:uncharacterized protein K489DRAFT_95480 [Dissoconium aciculare CBS 342.82]KAF1818489.1 hypothetical protein K489DRAFT_95480 [Dissoconium aciculare CBS 342.82]